MGRRSQTTLFFIVAIVILLIIGFILYNISVQKNSDFTDVSSTTTQEINYFLDDCVRTTVLDGEVEWGLDKEISPPLISQYVEDYLPVCLNDFKQFGNTFDIEKGKLDVNVSITSSSVIVEVTYPLRFLRQDYELEINKQTYTFPRLTLEEIDKTKKTQIVSTDGTMMIEIPPGTTATLDGQEVKRVGIKQLDREFNGNENGVAAGMLAFLGYPHGTKFSQPVKITLTYRDEDIPPWIKEKDLRLGYVSDGFGNNWYGLPSEVDTVNNVITVWTDHFSQWANVMNCEDDGAEGFLITPTLVRQDCAAGTDTWAKDLIPVPTDGDNSAFAMLEQAAPGQDDAYGIGYVPDCQLSSGDATPFSTYNKYKETTEPDFYVEISGTGEFKSSVGAAKDSAKKKCDYSVGVDKEPDCQLVDTIPDDKATPDVDETEYKYECWCNPQYYYYENYCYSDGDTTIANLKMPDDSLSPLLDTLLTKGLTGNKITSAKCSEDDKIMKGFGQYNLVFQGDGNSCMAVSEDPYDAATEVNGGGYEFKNKAVDFKVEVNDCSEGDDCKILPDPVLASNDPPVISFSMEVDNMQEDTTEMYGSAKVTYQGIGMAEVTYMCSEAESGKTSIIKNKCSVCTENTYPDGTPQAGQKYYAWDELGDPNCYTDANGKNVCDCVDETYCAGLRVGTTYYDKDTGCHECDGQQWHECEKIKCSQCTNYEDVVASPQESTPNIPQDNNPNDGHGSVAAVISSGITGNAALYAQTSDKPNCIPKDALSEPPYTAASSTSSSGGGGSGGGTSSSGGGYNPGTDSSSFGGGRRPKCSEGDRTKQTYPTCPDDFMDNYNGKTFTMCQYDFIDTRNKRFCDAFGDYPVDFPSLSKDTPLLIFGSAMRNGQCWLLVEAQKEVDGNMQDMYMKLDQVQKCIEGTSSSADEAIPPVQSVPEEDKYTIEFPVGSDLTHYIYFTDVFEDLTKNDIKFSCGSDDLEIASISETITGVRTSVGDFKPLSSYAAYVEIPSQYVGGTCRLVVSGTYLKDIPGEIEYSTVANAGRHYVGIPFEDYELDFSQCQDFSAINYLSEVGSDEHITSTRDDFGAYTGFEVELSSPCTIIVKGKGADSGSKPPIRATIDESGKSMVYEFPVTETGFDANLYFTDMFSKIDSDEFTCGDEQMDFEVTQTTSGAVHLSSGVDNEYGAYAFQTHISDDLLDKECRLAINGTMIQPPHEGTYSYYSSSNQGKIFVGIPFRDPYLLNASECDIEAVKYFAEDGTVVEATSLRDDYGPYTGLEVQFKNGPCNITVTGEPGELPPQELPAPFVADFEAPTLSYHFTVDAGSPKNKIYFTDIYDTVDTVGLTCGGDEVNYAVSEIADDGSLSLVSNVPENLDYSKSYAFNVDLTDYVGEDCVLDISGTLKEDMPDQTTYHSTGASGQLLFVGIPYSEYEIDDSACTYDGVTYFSKEATTVESSDMRDDFGPYTGFGVRNSEDCTIIVKNLGETPPPPVLGKDPIVPVLDKDQETLTFEFDVKQDYTDMSVFFTSMWNTIEPISYTCEGNTVPLDVLKVSEIGAKYSTDTVDLLHAYAITSDLSDYVGKHCIVQLHGDLSSDIPDSVIYSSTEEAGNELFVGLPYEDYSIDDSGCGYSMITYLSKDGTLEETNTLREDYGPYSGFMLTHTGNCEINVSRVESPCVITGAELVPDCGEDGCQTGDNLGVELSYEGNCPDEMYVEMSAIPQEDRMCMFK